MDDLYLTPAEKYTAALGGFYYGDLPEPVTVYTQLIKDILNGTTPDKEPKNILARFIYSLYISDLGDPYPRYELAKLLYWKLHDITPTKSGSILTVTIDGKEDYMTINTDLSRLWYKVLFGSKTDVITEFPYIFNTMQNKLSDWELFGNTETSGTPTPDSPIMPQGTGERTGNLFDKDTNPVSLYYQTQREVITIAAGVVSIIMPVSPNTTYTFNNPAGNRNRICETETVPEVNDTVINYIASDGNVSITLTTSNNTHYILWWVGYQQTYSDIKEALSVNLGSTALPYEPYGYKIQISSAGQTNNIYLGEVETTRRIKKLVLTGNETYAKQSGTTLYSYNLLSSEKAQARDLIKCSHLPFSWSYSTTISIHIYSSLSTIFLNFGIDVMDAQPSGNTVAGLKEYIAAQYAAGTPVTVWYVLANEETAVVNEQLMKIGEYSDSLSRAQTGIDIPTVIGQNTLDVLTTVKPSSMRIEYTSADETRSRSKRISLLKKPLVKSIKR